MTSKCFVLETRDTNFIISPYNTEIENNNKPFKILNEEIQSFDENMIKYVKIFRNTDHGDYINFRGSIGLDILPWMEICFGFRIERRNLLHNLKIKIIELINKVKALNIDKINNNSEIYNNYISVSRLKNLGYFSNIFVNSEFDNFEGFADMDFSKLGFKIEYELIKNKWDFSKSTDSTYQHYSRDYINNVHIKRAEFLNLYPNKRYGVDASSNYKFRMICYLLFKVDKYQKFREAFEKQLLLQN